MTGMAKTEGEGEGDEWQGEEVDDVEATILEGGPKREREAERIGIFEFL